MAVSFPPLPDFERPPVTEVVLSLQFEGVDLQIQHVGMLWQRYRARFPKIETKPPLDAVIEDLKRIPSRTLRFELSDAPTLPRTWFVAESGTELIQIQSDRFIHNWRKAGIADAYPRYERIREQFAAELAEFIAFVDETGLGQLKPVQCEITYINHVMLTGDMGHGDAYRILRALSDVQSGFLGKPESQQIAARYVLEHPATGKPFARLYVEMTPALSSDRREPIFVLNFTVRGAPTELNIASALDFYDAARRYIVCGFAAMTTSEMHHAWGKKNDS